jgi:hypothetical protein
MQPGDKSRYAAVVNRKPFPFPLTATLAGAIVLWLLTSLLPTAGAVAVAQGATGAAGNFHWAYAANYGTGVYSVDDGSEVLIVRVPVRVQLRAADPDSRCNCTIRLLAPVTLGVENFDRSQAANSAPPRQARQFGVLPGVELEFPRTERWTLRARAQVGWGIQKHETREEALIYAVGIRSRYSWPDAPGRPAMINGLLWSGYDPDRGARRSMTRMTSGMEFDIHVPRWEFREHTMRLMPHVLGDWYLDTVDARELADGRTGVLDNEWEVGVAAGRTEPFRILGFPLDRVGIAIRESTNGSGVRVFFGSIF